MPAPSDQISYPQTVDSFPVVVDVNTPANIIYAALLRRVQNALAAIQTHTLYTAIGPAPATPILSVVTQQQTFPSNTASKIYKMRFDLDTKVANSLFGGTPFASENGVMPSITAYHMVNGQPVYYRVQCALDPVNQSSSSVILNCFKSAAEWSRGDVINAQLLLIQY